MSCGPAAGINGRQPACYHGGGRESIGKVLDIRIELPEDPSDDAAEVARTMAREAAILSLQQQGELTIREAAAELGLTYHAYMQLLAERGLPATSDEGDPEVLAMLRDALTRQAD